MFSGTTDTRNSENDVSTLKFPSLGILLSLFVLIRRWSQFCYQKPSSVTINVTHILGSLEG